MARVAIVFTGGTISMGFDPVAGGNVPALDGAAILARTPGLDAIAEVVPIDHGLTPASHFTFVDVLEIGRVVQGGLDDPAIDGAVVVQGTDTIEETSFAWDLVLRSPKPVVVTGAMRAPHEAGYDGPANLRDAVRCGRVAALRDAGVVVDAGRHDRAADDVTKTPHHGLHDVPESPNGGTLGRVVDGRVGRASGRADRAAVSRQGREAGRVHLHHGRRSGRTVPSIDAAVAAGARRDRRCGDRGRKHVARLARPPRSGRWPAASPVALASRCPARCRVDRRTPSRAAARRGSGPARSASGTLCALKARVALALGIGAGLSRERWRASRRPLRSPDPLG